MFDGRWRAGVDKGTVPVADALQRTGIKPDHLTGLGLGLSGVAAVVIGSGRLGLGLALVIGAALPDLLDGAVAKVTGTASVRGAFFDSVADRVTDALILGGVAWFLQSERGGHMALLPTAVLATSMLISYQRAKAESLGFTAKGGLMERAERIIALCVGLAFSSLLVPVLWLMLALTTFTAVQRFAKVWRQASAAPAAPAAPAAQPVPVAAAPGATSEGQAEADDDAVAFPRLDARWQAWREQAGWGAERRSSRSRPRSSAETLSSRWRERRSGRPGVDGRRRRTRP